MLCIHSVSEVSGANRAKAKSRVCDPLSCACWGKVKSPFPSVSLPIVGCPLVCVRCAGCSGCRWPAVLCGRACSQALIGNQQREPAHSHHLGRMKPEGHSPPWTDPGTKGWMAEHPLQPPGACGGQAFFYLWVALVLAFSVTWHFHQPVLQELRAALALPASSTHAWCRWHRHLIMCCMAVVSFPRVPVWSKSSS